MCYEQFTARKAPNQELLEYVKADERILNTIKYFDSRAPLQSCLQHGKGYKYDMH